MQPLVSIIMPAYNVELYIAKAIESVLNQTHREIECIIVNDGSPDQSGAIAERYAQLDNRIKVLHKQNGGLADARNAGLAIAQGKYVHFIDSDDYIDDNLLARAVNAAEEHKADIVIFGYWADELDTCEQLVSRRQICCNSGVYQASDYPKLQLNANLFNMVGYAWNKLYRRQLLQDINAVFTKGLSLVEDIVFNLPVLSSADRLVILDKAFYHYNQRERKTLVYMYYQNAFELHIKGLNCRRNLFKHWGADERLLEQLSVQEHIKGIRYCCANLFYYKNPLSFKEKYNNIQGMLTHELTRQLFTHYQGVTKLEYLLLLSSRYNLAAGLYLLYFLLSFKRLKQW